MLAMLLHEVTVSSGISNNSAPWKRCAAVGHHVNEERSEKDETDPEQWSENPLCPSRYANVVHGRVAKLTNSAATPGRGCPEHRKTGSRRWLPRLVSAPHL